MENTSYNIYNASAGSGKTYTLTKSYLKIILSSATSANYREILAITFTNKAVAEMKERIIDSLYDFGKVKTADHAPSMFLDLVKELHIDVETLQKRAKTRLKEILHNYAFFDVSTIDKFTHRLIRTFAKDLKLPQNFEVILDTNLLLSEAVDRLVNKAGVEPELTKVLIAFALEKANEDKSWDISRDIFDMGRELLFKEKYEDALEAIEQKNIGDFDALKKLLKTKIKKAEDDIQLAGKTNLQLMTDNGLELKDFKSSYFSKFMIDVAELKPTINFNAAWKQDFENTALYTKTLAEDKKATIDSLHQTFNKHFQVIKTSFFELAFLKNAYKNIVPLTVLNALQKELKNLELERDEIPLATFNSIISKEIKNQPVPFIYERLGEKYRHYFIDEFQDTSELQWSNLIPLIGNALESQDEKGNNGSLLLVGDAKQAIYRWRGGKAEQFLNLVHQTKNPFVNFPNVENLPANYRSYHEVINFNNSFFSTISANITNTVYKELYEEGNKQKVNNKKGGFIQISFIAEEDKNEDELYCNEVLQTITTLSEKKYPLKDICILVRDKKHGILLADFLSTNKIPIISSETLLLKNNPKVNFLANLLKFSVDSEDFEAAYALLFYLGEQTGQPKHAYISENLNKLELHLSNQYNFEINTLKQSSVYDGFEQAVKHFNLVDESDAYITYFLDEVLDVEYKQGASATLFLDYWEKKQDMLSISAPLEMDAVQIMTVHKSKGLEFEVVLFPYANSHIYKEIKPKTWLPVAAEEFNGFTDVLINKNKEIVNYSETAESIYNEEHEKLELDAFNVLYVALTRAVKCLFIFTKKEYEGKTENPKTDYYSGLFISYLKQRGVWQDLQLHYQFGQLDENKISSEVLHEQEEIKFQYSFKERTSFKIVTTSGMLWDTTAEAALSKGNTIHKILSLIETVDDITPCFEMLVKKGSLSTEEVPLLELKVRAIIEHRDLKEFYTKDAIVKNETDIITKNGIILRPDRLVINENKATIIDYKTGARNISYKDQIDTYAYAIEEMGYQINKKIIIYINEEIIPEFI
ncbi:UvrD-helicase domain-containing protein [Cellulophaga sp. Z1A5H]|uniref:UvrD-helicase domain-containing protein n=1 Tax=Cellulophaga sp. Z1A5H TaxID=2687291 RepID=UPI0013FDC221|nr:UvrD-helicase domain-containing protein [Cellulophaga sp. Z1A5H]